ncbi:MAG: FMN-binding protein [Treponema sp.]|jgi:uncharacterized protein with FMN-binding domain|nr:FMN-binding protein [Treponema sp.]
MKHLFVITALAVALAAAAFAACAGYKAADAADAVYEGAAMGYRGIIRVRVGMERGRISEITVVESSEDGAVGGAAMEELADLALAYNTTELDAISGATETSRGFLAAIENAIMGP